MRPAPIMCVFMSQLEEHHIGNQKCMGEALIYYFQPSLQICWNHKHKGWSFLPFTSFYICVVSVVINTLVDSQYKSLSFLFFWPFWVFGFLVILEIRWNSLIISFNCNMIVNCCEYFKFFYNLVILTTS